MLKLLIADDERIIRETIYQLIDWTKYDIEVIGLCKNGLETYDMIMDENPEIVLTDIKMPGMSGLELIEKISETAMNIQFIILSGYGEFEYAKAAMKYGVRHYLLKPCNEDQIIECLKECKKDYFQRKINAQLASDKFPAVNSMYHNVVFSILNDSICQNKDFKSLKKTYESYIDFNFTPYRLYYIYFLEFEYLESFLERLKEFCRYHFSNVTIHGVYVNNTLLLFFKSFQANWADFECFIYSCLFPGQQTSLETDSSLFTDLENLLTTIIPKIRRFGSIYYINNFRILYTCNYNTHINQLNELHQLIRERKKDSLEQLSLFLNSIGNLNFLKQITSNLLMKLSLSFPIFSASELTEILIKIEEEQDINQLKHIVVQKVESIVNHPDSSNNTSLMTQQIYDYVNSHLRDSNLTLTYIAEHCLFMNVDYVSKKFLKETGTKFSFYLADTRIKKAKQLLASGEYSSIQNVAEEVGLGNNPQYFSQLFKKMSGMTPSAYVTQLSSRY